MVNKELLDYVKNQLDAGVDEAGLKATLSDAGWLDVEIREAMESAKGAGPGPPGAERTPVQEAPAERVRENKGKIQEQISKIDRKEEKDMLEEHSPYTYGILLSIIGGVLILIDGIYTIALREMTSDLFSQFGLAFYLFQNDFMSNVMFGVIVVVIGILVLILNTVLKKRSRGNVRGVITLIASIAGIFFGGLLIGPIIGIAGGILLILQK